MSTILFSSRTVIDHSAM